MFPETVPVRLTLILVAAVCSCLGGCATSDADSGSQAAATAVEKQWESDRPAFYGVWQIVADEPELKTTGGEEPPLLPEARARYEKTRALHDAGDTSWDPVYECNIHGVPRILFESMPFEILQTPKQVFIMYQWNREFRMIDMNVEHSELPFLNYMGQSVGHWEGDTLVVDSNQFNDVTYLDASGMPHSEELHVVERYSVADDGNTLTARILIEDPETFAAPWEATATFRKLQGASIEEDTCVDRLDLPQYR